MQLLFFWKLLFTLSFLMYSPARAQENPTDTSKEADPVYVQFQGNNLAIMHGAIQFVVWLILVPIDLIIVRYLKVWPYWSHFHRTLMRFLTFETSIFSIINLAVDNPRYSESSFKESHRVFGILVTIMILIQFVIGMIFLRIMKSVRPVRLFSIVKFIHRYIGYSIYLFAFNNIALGTAMAAPYLLKPLFIWYGVILVVVLIMELWWRDPDAVVFRWLRSLCCGRAKHPHQVIYGVRKYTPKQFDEMIKLGNNWCLMGDNIYDVKELLKSHPGSKMLIKKAIGMDISKYFYGSEQLLSYYPSYSHSVHAEKLLKSLFCGVIKTSALMKIPRNLRSDGPLLDTSSYERDQNMWKIVDKTRLSKNFWRLTLISKHYLINGAPDGWDWISKYMKVSFMMDGALIQRHYCFVPYLKKLIDTMKELQKEPPLGKSEEEFHRLLNPQHETELGTLNNIERPRPSRLLGRIYHDEENCDIEITHRKNFQEELHLYIRKQKFGSSEILLNHELGATVEVAGPMGKSPDFFAHNNICMFAAGSSILGFCDAIYVFYQMIANELKSVGSTVDAIVEIERTGNKRGSTLEENDQLIIVNTAKVLTVFISMKCLSDCEGLGLGFLDKIQKLSQRTQKYQFNYFITVTECADGAENRCGIQYETGRFTRESIQEKFPEGVEKVFVSGSQDFKKHISTSLQEIGMPFPLIEQL